MRNVVKMLVVSAVVTVGVLVVQQPAGVALPAPALVEGVLDNGCKVLADDAGVYWSRPCTGQEFSEALLVDLSRQGAALSSSVKIGFAG